MNWDILLRKNFLMWLAFVFTSVSPSNLYARNGFLKWNADLKWDDEPISGEGIDSENFQCVEKNKILSESAALPVAGEWIALVAGNRVCVSGTEDIFMAEVSPFLLQNGTLAYDRSFLSWRCVYQNNTRFYLQNHNGEGLESCLQNVQKDQLWTVEGEYVVTATSPRRYLVYEEGAEICLRTKEELDEYAASPVVLTAVGDSTVYEILESGLKVLEGCWSAPALERLDWKGTLALDLTHISLPLHPRSFAHLPLHNNILIYVAEEGLDVLPPSWKNVVVCQSNGKNRLLRDMKLIEGCPFALHRPIDYKVGQLRYERMVHADQGWETLCLPFDGSLPFGLVGESFRGFSEDGSMLFSTTQVFQANEPIIIRNVSGTSSGDFLSVIFSSGEGTMHNMPPRESGFIGTYDPITVASEDDLFFLNQGGTSFVRAAQGSHLSPFRGYVITDKSRRIQHMDTATGVPSAEMDGKSLPYPSEVYALDGRKIPYSVGGKEKLPQGIYIVNGRKFIKQ